MIMKMMTAFLFSTIMIERVRTSEVMMRVINDLNREQTVSFCQDAYVVVFEQPEEFHRLKIVNCDKKSEIEQRFKELSRVVVYKH